MADAGDLKSPHRKMVWVRVPPSPRMYPYSRVLTWDIIIGKGFYSVGLFIWLHGQIRLEKDV
jgi:hypothetical protein